MRRYLTLVFILFLVSCRPARPTQPAPSLTALPTTIQPTPSASQTRQPTPTRTPITPSPTATPVPPTFTLTPTVSPTPTETFTQTPEPTPASAQYFVLFHPDGGLYVGDQVSFEVIAPPQQGTKDQTPQVEAKGPGGARLGSAGFAEYGLGQRDEAVLLWAWDTRGLEAGEYPITFALQPSGTVWTETLTLLPQADLPWPEPQAHWAEARSKYTVIHYITGTAAERDLPDLLNLADEQANDAIQRMGVDFTAPITVTMLSRMLGQGGFASDEIDVSYLDRNYSGSIFGLVLHHEMIHILDARLGGDYRPSLFVEGLAVYESGGHFKPEPLMPRAAALLSGGNRLGWYIPLAEIADNFYLSQHEISYLEGASLIEYMVNTWGWQAFSSFYRDIHTTPDGKPSSAIDAALQKHFQLTFSELEDNFKAALSKVILTPQLLNDMRLSVEFFDAMRRYQQLLDPSAYFATAWLIDGPSARKRGIVADDLRHPVAVENQAIEAMLTNAFTALVDQDYPTVDQGVSAVNAVLDAIQADQPNPFNANSEAADYFAIVQVLHQAGYEAQKISVDSNTAHIQATAGSAKLVDLTLMHGDSGWSIVANNAWLGEIKNGDFRWVIPRKIPIFVEWTYLNP
jgi:hypothetical protein